MKGRIRYCVVALLLACSCHSELAPQQYVQYVQDINNGLRKAVKVAEWEYLIQYRPADLIILTENKGALKNNMQNKRKEQLKGMAWFNISFRLVDGKVSPLRYDLSSRGEYDIRLNYFLNEAAKSIKLICGTKDTLVPVSYLFENNFNLTPQETMVVGFQLPAGREGGDLQLSYEDKVFKTGTIKTIFKKEDLENIPKLVY
jgi:hypothetical protein